MLFVLSLAPTETPVTPEGTSDLELVNLTDVMLEGEMPLLFKVTFQSL